MFPHCSLGWANLLVEPEGICGDGKGHPYSYDMPVNMWTPPTSIEAVAR